MKTGKKTSAEKLERIIRSQSGVLFLKGAPGTGKSAILKSIADKNGWNFIDIRLSQVDSSEVIGIPVKSEVRGVGCMAYLPPQWAVEANSTPTLVLFDELNRAQLDVRNASLQILLDRKVGQYALNENVYLASAGNLGEEDGTEVEELDSALNNRLVHVKHTLTFDEWVSEFAEAHVHPFIVSFLRENTGYFHRIADNDSPAYPTPRSWTFLSNFIGKDAEVEKIKEDVIDFGIYYVGGSATQAFLRYLEDVEKISVEDVLNDYPQKREVILSLDRSIISYLVGELVNCDIDKLSKGKVSNLISFLKDIDQDETMSFIVGLLDATSVEQIKNLSENKKKIFGEFKTIQDIILSGEGGIK